MPFSPHPQIFFFYLFPWRNNKQLTVDQGCHFLVNLSICSRPTKFSLVAGVTFIRLCVLQSVSFPSLKRHQVLFWKRQAGTLWLRLLAMIQNIHGSKNVGVLALALALDDGNSEARRERGWTCLWVQYYSNISSIVVVTVCLCGICSVPSLL